MENVPFVPISVINEVGTPKFKSSQDVDDKKKVIYTKKAINILQSDLGMDKFIHASQCTTTKKIWDTLVETREGTAEVERSRLNTLS